MKKATALLATIFACLQASATMVSSDYAGTAIEGGIRDKCKQTASGPGEGGEFVFDCPVMAEAKDYGIHVTLWHHGAHVEFTYKGERIIEEEEIFVGMAHGNVWRRNLPDNYGVSWADWGLAKGTFEWRYQLKDGKKVPFALIFRRNFVSFAQNSDDLYEDMVVESKTSTLIVIQLDGNDSKLLGAVDSIKAHNLGKNANILARECADTLVGLGNKESCELYNPY